MAKEKTKEQLEAEAAAKKAADAAAAKKKADAEAKAQAEAAAKKAEALKDATEGYNKVSAIYEIIVNGVKSLTEQSLLDEVKAVQTGIANAIKDAKEGLKTVKAAARKIKDDAELKAAVNATEKLMAAIEEQHVSVKGRISTAREATKVAEKEKRDAERVEKQRLAQEEKERKLAEREAKKEPEQNGVRKPGAGTLCRAAWDIFDAVSAELGQTAPISYILPVTNTKGLNEANVKAEYARWKKYMGITGRVSVPVPANIAKAADSVVIPAPKAE